MKRVQRKRSPGWRMPPNTKYVGRPTKFGNPFNAKELGNKEAVKRYEECLSNPHMVYVYFDEIEASIQCERFQYMKDNLFTLAGLNLACFCPLDVPCHVDVIVNKLKEILG